MNDLFDQPKKKQSVNEYVLEQLLKGRRISRLSIFNEIWCMTLNSRIPEIRSDGYVVEDEYVRKTNGRGETKSFKEYWMTADEIARHA